jgi:uncharacterized membrane protein YagU involved in acid resistance
MLFFYSQIFKKYLNKVVSFHIKMATGFILSIAITLALGMLLVPAIGTVVFAQNLPGMAGNASEKLGGMAGNMTGMAGNASEKLSNMTEKAGGMIGNLTK